jgi:hypothetical protein
VSGREPPALDLAAPAGALSAARLAALRSPQAAVPEAVWEDAQRQLAGMVEGLETLQRAVPALGQPSVSDEADTSEGRGHREQGEGARP